MSIPVAPKIIPIILAGGTGTRLWPMSRSSRAKQFLTLSGKHSLFQETLLRLASDPRYDAPIVITNEDYRFLVAEQALEVSV
ncbi:MAG TPA: mannose-1-phosphate guanylyltransferase/mannose-6-phosphate isomerase, partial [Hyphomonas sp.]|nr:mannose-1-phosphate guanylyltransferase/mannose-6-phosphate isomerase [Hyphomonas sp.]